MSKILIVGILNLIIIILSLLSPSNWVWMFVAMISYMTWCICFHIFKISPGYFALIDLLLPCIYFIIIIPILYLIVAMGAGAGNSWIPKVNFYSIILYLILSIPNIVYSTMHLWKWLNHPREYILYRLINNVILLIVTCTPIIYLAKFWEYLIGNNGNLMVFYSYF